MKWSWYVDAYEIDVINKWKYLGQNLGYDGCPYLNVFK